MDTLRVKDLVTMWVYDRRGIYNLRQRPDFPSPVKITHGGRVPHWRPEDIAEYAKAYPELTSERLKRAKVASFRRCILRKQRGL